jgi:hypothetical protein
MNASDRDVATQLTKRPLERSLFYYNTTRFRTGGRVFEHSFDDANRWESLDGSKPEIEWQPQSLAVPPRNKRMLARSGKLRTIRAGRRWRPDPIHTLLATGFLAVLGVTLVILIQNIHSPPGRLTLQKDAAELASLERQSRLDAASGEAGNQPSPPAGSTGIDLVEAQLQERSQPAVAKPALIASRATSPDRKRNIRSEGARELRASKSLQNPQTRRVADLARRRYEQRGLDSFFAGLRHALGFSKN